MSEKKIKLSEYLLKINYYLCDKDNYIVMKRTEKVLLIYTGGTIGMGCNPATGALEPLDFEHLADNVPEFKLIPTAIDTYQFIPAIDSSNMSPKNWADIVRIIVDRYNSYDGFVILHGTDTMAYTASALSFMLENLTKPVILTGSQLPIGQLRTDGKENLMTSLELAAAHHHDGTPMVPEVCIYFNGHLLRGNRSTKQNADELNAFELFNFPHLCEAGVSFNFQTHHILKPDYSQPMVPHFELDSNVFVLSLFPGAEESIIRHTFDAPELRGIIMRTYGSGNAPHASWLVNLLKEASQRGVVTVNVSQCISGQADMNRYDTGYQLKEAGVISGYDTTVEAALTKLMLLQAKYSDHTIVREYMNKSIAGEITIPNSLI